MGGGLMQLVAYGAQDIYLTGNPQITFFKVVYRRHTNFAMESIEQTLNGNVAASSKVTATISRNGDLVGKTYLAVQAAAMSGSDNNYGTQIIENVVLEIGGQQIDKHSGLWMETWFELTEPNHNGSSYLTVEANLAAAVTGGDAATAPTKFQQMACCGGVGATNTVVPGLIHVPLTFWFCRNPGLALPLIALQYHEVKIAITFSAALNETAAKLWCDYIYLDTDERRRFAQVSHEYLIEQVQEQSGSASLSQELNFNHPVKELIWTGAYTNAGSGGVATGGMIVGPVMAFGTADVNTMSLKLNGHERFAPRGTKYFTRTQVWQHHSGYGSVMGGQSDGIAVYSFALKPEEHQPSGTCNFSRIDNAQLKGTASPCPANGAIFAVNYNVLRIMSGMGGLAYSN